jgi:molybdopterin-guanine dinucleotide biosynthesis protein A
MRPEPAGRLRRLGAILAGGTSSRFGSDKALALHQGRPLIAHVADALLAQCDALVICGRDWGGHPSLADLPGPGLGPMGGLCAALAHAARNGFAEVLAAPCDLLGVEQAATHLAPGPAVAAGQWLLGLWPAPLSAGLLALLQCEGAVSARRWIALSKADERPIPGLRNINRPQDLP